MIATALRTPCGHVPSLTRAGGLVRGRRRGTRCGRGRSDEHGEHSPNDPTPSTHTHECHRRVEPGTLRDQWHGHHHVGSSGPSTALPSADDAQY